MNQDPLHKKIVEALAGKLDGHSFERCAQELLGVAYPNLAPVVGGSDAGMDGAFGTKNGDFPLICTVERNVIGNFRKSIKTYLTTSRGPKKAVIATSQVLTPQKRRNLKQVAADLGVTLVNVHDAAYFADQLHRNKHWRLQLLGITGDPSALSIFPLSGRYVGQPNIIGREKDIEWLQKNMAGDALVVGPPGSGKTFLHQHLATKGACLFAIDPSRDKLADAVRDQNPTIIVVDDSHIRNELLQNLRQLRVELGATYRIHANCWPSYTDYVSGIMQIPSENIRNLKPWTRREILEIIKARGIAGPDWLLHFLVDQADGKPGLAASLAESCKTEDLKRIWTGELLTEQLAGNRMLVPDEKTRCILAAFSLGGDDGMAFHDVAEALNLLEIDLREATSHLASGGLVDELGDGRLQVRPPAIRSILVREVFFLGAHKLNPAKLLACVRSAIATTDVLLSARHRGAEIDTPTLERWVLCAQSLDAWEHFGWCDKDCAANILEKHQNQICAAAPGLLNYFPDRTLEALLDADESNAVSHEGAVEHPRRRIKEWLFPHGESPYATIERRQALLGTLERRITAKGVGAGKTIAWASAAILQAGFRNTSSSPGDRREFQIIQGVASPTILNEVVALWPRILKLFSHVPNSAVRDFLEKLEVWCFPQRLSATGLRAESSFELMRQHAPMMLSDILKLPNCSRAWKTWASNICKWAEMEIDVSVDPDFDLIYAERDSDEDWRKEADIRDANLQEFAQRLVHQPASEVVRYLNIIRQEASEFELRGGRLDVIYFKVATLCSRPKEWLDALIDHEAPSEFVAPFLQKICAENIADCEGCVKHLLGLPAYRQLAIGEILKSLRPSDDLIDDALDVLNEPDAIVPLWWRKETVSTAVMERLLTHGNPKIRSAAAVGEWESDPRGSVRPKLAAAWRIAIRDIEPNNHVLKQVVESD